MRTKFAIGLLLTTVISFCASAELRSDLKKDKYGFVDENGKVVIKHQYAQVLPFQDGLAKVKKGDKWGYINSDNKAIIPIKFDEIGPFYNNEFALVRTGSNYGYIRKDGSYMIKPEWKAIGLPNAEGYIWVANNKNLQYAAKGLYKYDKQVLKAKYTNLGFYQKTDSVDYSDGHPFSSADASEITRNKTTLSTSDVPYIWTVTGGIFHNSGICDLTGQEVVPNKGKALGAPHDGLALNRSYNANKRAYTFNYFILGQKGKKLFKKDVVVDADNKQGCFPFKHGSAINIVGTQGYIINTQGVRTSNIYESVTAIADNCYSYSLNGKYGLLASDGSVLTDCVFSNMAGPKGDKPIFGVQDAQTKLWGMIDNKGEVVIPFNYALVYGCIHDRYYVKDNTGWGVLSADKRVIVAPVWSDMMPALNKDDNFMWVKKPSQKWECLDMTSDKVVHNFKLDEVTSFEKNGQSLVKNDSKYGVVNTKGEIVIPFMFQDKVGINDAREYLKKEGKSVMSSIDAYRYSVKKHPNIKKQVLQDRKVSDELWDY